MRSATLFIAASLALVAAAPSGQALNACAGTGDGLAHACVYADWQDPAVCARVDANPPSGHVGTGTCVNA